MKAFPVPTAETSINCHSAEFGMDLRDYFAAKAMPHCQFLLKDADDYFSSDTPEIVAKMAYVMADEMLKAREQ